MIRIGNIEIDAVHGSVLEQETEAIVNAASRSMRGGGGVDGAIHQAAGPGLLDELRRTAPNGANTGDAVITAGHRLKQPWIIHTPGPIWRGGGQGEAQQLASSYRSCLEIADKTRLRSIAFCSISTGVYGFPLEQAAPLAVQTVRDWALAHPETTLVRLVFALYGEREYKVFSAALGEMAAAERVVRRTRTPGV